MSSSQPPSESIPHPSDTTPASEDEFDALMRSSPVVEDRDGWDSFLPGPTEGDTPSTQVLNADSAGLPSSIGPIRNNLALARHLAASADLKPYQKMSLDTFIKSDNSIIRDIHFFIQQCSLHNKLDTIISSIPAYAISEALDANIKSLVVAVLLSSRLPSYKGDLPKDAVMTILLRDRLHIPSTYDRDTNVSNTIEAAIKEELRQCRSKIKKLIKWSVSERKSIFMLGTKVVKDTRCTVTVPLCGKLALLRKVYADDSGSKFWDKVDIRLEKLREKAAGDDRKIARVFRGLLDADKELYPQSSQENTKMSVEDNSSNDWQRGIDLSLSGQQAISD